MRFADELRGSEGESCKVTDLRTGTVHHGVIESWHDGAQKAVVKYDDGTRVQVGYSFVTLLTEEGTEAMSALSDAMQLVIDDCATDAEALEGAPFSRRVMGENFGILYAMIQAVTKAVVCLDEQVSA